MFARTHPRRRRVRRGNALIAAILLLLVATLVVTGLLQTGARDQDLSVRRLETVQAFYAAEAGMNMAVREMMLRCDDDSDGAVGTISDDGNDTNDPALGTGQVVVTSSIAGAQTTLTCAGRAGLALRTFETVVK